MRSGSNAIVGNGREPVRVRLLGGFSVRVGDRVVDGGEWRLRKAAALVKLARVSSSLQSTIWDGRRCCGEITSGRKATTKKASRSAKRWATGWSPRRAWRVWRASPHPKRKP